MMSSLFIWLAISAARISQCCPACIFFCSLYGYPTALGLPVQDIVNSASAKIIMQNRMNNSPEIVMDVSISDDLRENIGFHKYSCYFMYLSVKNIDCV